MAYTRITWINDETPLDADNLNRMESGIEEAVDGSSIDPEVLSLYAALGWIDPNGE